MQDHLLALVQENFKALGSQARERGSSRRQSSPLDVHEKILTNIKKGNNKFVTKLKDLNENENASLIAEFDNGNGDRQSHFERTYQYEFDRWVLKADHLAQCFGLLTVEEPSPEFLNTVERPKQVVQDKTIYKVEE
ncbi:hypothetical protein FGADI_6288 [Fusarium gaditjirri]|uniref:Uncharacterized protein n=1 Tax=Fusarium gaditjirri TaxID=282569 RepID=A0A8H4T8B2_9HYPO|nr:hypothetical protein FGADI_6288 [Fusarium gaditjirri]